MASTVATPERTKGLQGLEGKNVLVTGGSSGIGQAIAVRFAEYGANVAINYLRDPSEARETEDQVQACVAKVQREGVRDVLVGGDVSKEDDVVAMVSSAIEQLGGVDVLVNNAGIQISRPSDELSAEDFDKVIAVNLRGAFMCAREAIRHFLAEEKPGVIVNISSVHQIIPKPDYLGYSASKGGMQNMTRTLALEYAGRAIRVNGVGPGATVTPINRAWIDDPEKRKAVEEHIPMQRAGDADEMAGVTAFLASDEAAYITGQTIFVDGGLTLFPELRDPLVVGVSVSVAAPTWWPSPFGAEDELGMLNHVDEAKRLEALGLVREGRLYDLGRILDETIPVFPGRYFRQTLVTTAHHANAGSGGVGENEVNWVTEQLTGTTQLGTHLDTLSHLQIGERGYNGWTVAELASDAGVTRLGAETVPQIVTRGWLVDVSDRELGPGDVIGPDDLNGIEPEPGDAVLFHTSWGAHWDDSERYLAGEPGPGLEVAAYLAERGVAVTGCDTWSCGPVPPEDPNRPFEVPQTLNVRHGVFVLENLDTAALAADRVRTFALVVTHPKLRGATGAWTSPIAIV